MANTTEVWILSGAVTVLSIIVGFAANIIAQQVIKRLDNIIVELQSLGKLTTMLETTTRNLQDTVAVHSVQLQENTNQINDQSHRILKLELEFEKK